MGKIRQGRDVGGGVVVLKGDGKLQKVRCPKCHEHAVPARRADGTSVHRCPKGHEFVLSSM